MHLLIFKFIKTQYTEPTLQKKLHLASGTHSTDRQLTEPTSFILNKSFHNHDKHICSVVVSETKVNFSYKFEQFLITIRKKCSMAANANINNFLLAAVYEFLFRKDKNLASVFKTKCNSVSTIARGPV